MSNKINVYVSRDLALCPNRHCIALMDAQKDDLLELYFDESYLGLSINSIYLGEIIEKIQSLNALRVSFGALGEGFCNCSPEEFNLYSCGQQAPFQVKRLATEDKRTHVKKLPEVSLKWEIPGDFLVITSQVGQIGVSSKITHEETRARLKEIFRCKPLEKVGLIVRTTSQYADDEEILNDFARLYALVEQNVLDNKALLGSCLYQAEPFWKDRIRKYEMNGLLSRVICDDVELMAQVKEFNPRLYQTSSLHMFDFYRVSGQIEDAMRPRLDLKDGGYCLFEKTNAFYAVDVNSSMRYSGKNREESIYKINCRAAECLMRQITLRNWAGAIVVDFINMTNAYYIQQLKKKIEELAKLDPVPVSVYDFTRLFHLEIVRSHQGLSLEENIHYDESRAN